MSNINAEIQARIDSLYDSLRPLQELYGLKPKTIQERYEEYVRKQQIINNVRKPRFKLPKL